MDDRIMAQVLRGELMGLIDRQMAIDTEGLDAQIRCEMCRNPMHTDRGCDGNCKYDEKLYERIMQILDERIKPLQSVQPTYTDDQIQKMQDMEQAQLEKAFELGREDAKPQWIPIKRELPPVDETVLLSHRSGVTIGWYNGMSYRTNTSARCIRTVKAWMPLPEPYSAERRADA